MGLDQRGSPVFCVVNDASGQWQVKEEGFDKALASFDERSDALNYARDLANTKEGSQVKAYDQQGREVPV
ncbi:MAG: DUF2188 domain-containing protein [Burkholderiales bacterium]